MEFPDFDKMTPEEQMAWLESLARRQGAKDEELTTAADIEIAIPEDAVVDEPGYVPFFERERGARAQAEREEAPAEPVPQPPTAEESEVEPPREVYAGQSAEIRPDAEPAIEATPPSADPMQWLDSLTPHAEGEADDFDFAFELDDEAELEPLPFERAELEPPEAIEQARPVDTAQGSETQESEAAEEFDIEAFFLEAAGAPEGGTREDEGDLLQGVDPMRWLESLAVRQGAPAEELTTPADMEIPEVPEDTVIDEPGYVPFDVTGGTREPETVLRMILEAELEQEEFAPQIGEATPAAQVEPEAAPAGDVRPSVSGGLLDEMDESLAWLRDLVQDPSEADVAHMLDIDREHLGAAETAPAEAVGPTGEPVEAADPLAGLDDDEIAALQARGELTGEQELAWLQRQAEKLAEARRLEAEHTGEDVDAAELAELPDWLEEMREEAVQEAAAPAEVDDLFEEVDLEELPNWLTEPDAAGAADALASELDALWEPEAVAETPLPEIKPSPEVIEAFLEDQVAPVDALADALDEEYERQNAGEDAEPDWYTAAAAQAEEGAEAEPPAPAGAPELQQAVPVDLPDWLQEPVGEEVAEAEAMPDWLVEPEVGREAEPARLPAQPVKRPAPAPALAAALPDDPRFESYRERLAADPADYTTRLSLARALREHGNPQASLPHYEMLVESTQLLDEVSEDLSALATGPEAGADVHRILGDAYMRQGRLQQALDEYRTALEQL